MLTMGIDTALSHCSVAIMFDEQVLAENSVLLTRGHAEQIGPMVREICALADVSVVDFDRIGVVVGPGSFAGVRVGLAFARGLQIDGGPQIVGVSSLQGLALGVHDDGEDKNILALIDARQGYFYAAVFDRDAKVIAPPFIGNRNLIEETVFAAAKGRKVLLCGPAAGDFIQIGNLAGSASENTHIDAKEIANFCACYSGAKQNVSPLYLRPPDAAPKKTGRYSAVYDK
ncbi:MAG: tRNA (adenosine(37)-N6)-threonylcarbamoyltransferase complex dimerization subunit type 1 TsaB [Marinicaulis sp.]|nr:tRNA (adenosine(37)-N6)-threonylcarbamoyltransferase complex dimerization subunit type 1 TsaB [Marinicaulis sp.]